MLTIGMQKELLRYYLQDVLEKCDKDTWDHCMRVGKLCQIITEELGFDKYDVSRITMAGLLHDVGKIFMPEMINFPGKLADKERNIVSYHPQFGIRFISIHWSNLPVQVQEGIALHHERLDGQGYPYKLTEGEIPITARIVAVADVFDAMGTIRPYRMALSQKEIFSELHSLGYDQNIVFALTAYLRKNELM